MLKRIETQADSFSSKLKNERYDIKSKHSKDKDSIVKKILSNTKDSGKVQLNFIENFHTKNSDMIKVFKTEPIPNEKFSLDISE